MEVFTVTVLSFFTVHVVAGDFCEYGFYVGLDFFWGVGFYFCYFFCVLFGFALFVEDVILALVEADTSETILATDTIVAVVAVVGIFAVVTIIAVVAIEAVEGFVAKSAFLAEGAVVAIFTVEDAVVVHAIFGFVACEGHVAVFTTFCVLAKRAIGVIDALEADAWGFIFELFELRKESHGDVVIELYLARNFHNYSLLLALFLFLRLWRSTLFLYKVY